MYSNFDLKFVVILVWCCLLSCKEKEQDFSKEITAESLEKSELNDLMAELEKDSSLNHFQSVMYKLSSLTANAENEDKKSAYLLQAIQVCKKFDDKDFLPAFVHEFIIGFPTRMETKQLLEEMALQAEKDEKQLQSMLLRTGIAKKWPDPKTPWSQESYDDLEIIFKKDLASTGEKMFGSKNQFSPDLQRIQHFIEISAYHVYAFPDGQEAFDLLMKAGETAKSAGMGPKAIELFHWAWTIYKNNEKAPYALFLKGFTLETELKNRQEAIKTYKQFMETYPKHELANDVRILIKEQEKVK